MSSARQLADSLKSEYGRQKALLGLGDFYLVQQKFDSAETVLSRAMQINSHPLLLFETQNLLATAHRYQGNNQQAIQIYRDLLATIDSHCPATDCGRESPKPCRCLYQCRQQCTGI
ncbi:MAG: tetratricopeptide repeat protein [Balneolaceae bacterium]|nr:tetratricopeptide repeat protein [Balneolaceae bacterium]